VVGRQESGFLSFKGDVEIFEYLAVLTSYFLLKLNVYHPFVKKICLPIYQTIDQKANDPFDQNSPSFDQSFISFIFKY